MKNVEPALVKYAKPTLKVERISNLIGSSAGGPIGDSQAAQGALIINATTS